MKNESAVADGVLEMDESIETPLIGNAIKHVDAVLSFETYIGLPFWPERNFLINVGKEVHPKLGDQKKQQALLASLEKKGKTMGDYDRAIIRAARPFYTINDTDSDRGDGEIIVPKRHFLSFINNASQVAPKAVPSIKSKGLTFIGIKFRGAVDGFVTGKTTMDSQLFSRFVKLEDSNQRAWSESAYIADFHAKGILSVDEEIIKATDLRKLIEWGGKWVGIGSARPQGYGRFTVIRWDIR